mgnify:CR=1 FL=1
MGNESGEWIMHGMKWDNPDCIHSVDEAIKYINCLLYTSDAADEL